MPRISGTYSVPLGTEGFVDTTIESEKYNTYIHDVEKDLNDPRPISAGGTGANNADMAIANLGGEKSSQQVINYNTHVFFPGSFYSTSAIGQAAPVDGHAFVGIAVSSDPPKPIPDNKNVVIRAYDQSSTTVPGRIYVREKKPTVAVPSGVWGPWSLDGTGVSGPTPPTDPPDNLLWFDSEGGHLYVWYNDGNSKQWVIASPFSDPAQFLLKAGDTMVGALSLTVPPTDVSHATTKQYVDLTLNAAATSAQTQIDARVKKIGDTMSGALVAPVKGHVFGLPTGTAATGQVNRNDAAIKLYDNTGENWCGMGADVAGNMWFKAGTTGGLLPAMYIESNPGYRVVVQSGLHVSGSGGITSAYRVSTTNEIAGFFADNVNFFGFNGDTGSTSRSFYFTSPSRFLYNTATANLYWTAGTNTGFVSRYSDNAFLIGGEGYKPGGGAWVDSSDARIKNVEGDYPRGLAEIAQLRPVFYTYKGNDTSGPDAASLHKTVADSKKKFAGLVAQEVEIVIPEMVTQTAAHIDGVAVTDLRNLDITPLIFALVNCIKELKARVEALEGAT